MTCDNLLGERRQVAHIRPRLVSHQPGRDDKPTEDPSNQSLRLPGHSGLQGRKQLYTDSARLTPPDLPGSLRLTSPRMDMLSVLSTPCTNPTACHMATR